MSWTGVYTALITPFQTSGKGIDSGLLKTLISRQISAQVDGIILGGSTGEGQTLEQKELEDLIQFALNNFKGQIKILGACGFSGTEATAERYRWLSELGVDGVLVSTPPYNKPPQRGLIKHFEVIGSRAQAPIILYNIPGRTAVNLTPASIAEICSKVSQIVAVKESSGSLEQISQVRALLPSRTAVLSGDDPLNLGVWAIGGNGTVSVLSNVLPHSLVQLWRAWQSKDLPKAQKLHHDLMPLIQALFVESNPIPTKYLVGQLIKADLNPRLPLVPLDPTHRSQIVTTLKAVALSVGENLSL